MSGELKRRNRASRECGISSCARPTNYGSLRLINHGNDNKWEQWLERLYNLRRDKRGAHERPHKPVLLLSIIDLLDRGIIAGNEVPLNW